MCKKVTVNYKAFICTLVLGAFLIYSANIASVACDDIFEIVANIGSTFYSKLSSTLIVLAPVVFLVDLFILFVTRDQRKLEVEKKILITSVVTFFGILILDATLFSGSGMTDLKNTVSDWTKQVKK